MATSIIFPGVLHSPRALSTEAAPAAHPSTLAHGHGNPTHGGVGLLTYAGGPLLDTTSAGLTIHPVYWAPAGYAFPSGFQSTMNSFLADLATGSTATPPSNNDFALASQYFQIVANQPQFVQDILHAGPEVDDTSAYPASGCSPTLNTSATTCQDNFKATLYTYLQTNGYPLGLNDEYVLFFPPNVEVCFANSTSCTQGAFDGFCAYHAVNAPITDSSIDLIYAVIPFDPLCGADVTQSGAALATLQSSIVTHELAESITDPFLGTGWTGLGGEISDECDGLMSSEPLASGTWYVQEVFSDVAQSQSPAAGGCVATYTAPTLRATIVTTSLPSARHNTTYSATLRASGGVTPYYWILEQGTLPGGFILAGSTFNSLPTLFAPIVTARPGNYPLTFGLVTPGGGQIVTSVPMVLSVRPGPPTATTGAIRIKSPPPPALALNLQLSRVASSVTCTLRAPASNAVGTTISHYVIELKPRTKGQRTITSTVHAFPDFPVTTTLTGRARVRYEIVVEAVWQSGHATFWYGPAIIA